MWWGRYMNWITDLRLQHTRSYEQKSSQLAGIYFSLCFLSLSLYFQIEQKSNENNTKESESTGGGRIEFLMDGTVKALLWIIFHGYGVWEISRCNIVLFCSLKNQIETISLTRDDQFIHKFHKSMESVLFVSNKVPLFAQTNW